MWNNKRSRLRSRKREHNQERERKQEGAISTATSTSWEQHQHHQRNVNSKRRQWQQHGMTDQETEQWKNMISKRTMTSVNRTVKQLCCAPHACEWLGANTGGANRNWNQAFVGMRSMITVMWQRQHKLWPLRNDCLHGDDKTWLHLHEREQSLKETKELHRDKETMIVAERDVVSKNITH